MTMMFWLHQAEATLAQVVETAGADVPGSPARCSSLGFLFPCSMYDAARQKLGPVNFYGSSSLPQSACSSICGKRASYERMTPYATWMA